MNESHHPPKKKKCPADHLLDFDLLERAEPTRTCLHMQRATDTILLALGLVLAVDDRCKRSVRDLLERLGPTDVARVRIHEQEWLDLGNPSHDAAHRDQLTEMCALDLSNRDGHG